MELIAVFVIFFFAALFGRETTRVNMAQHGVSEFGQNVAGVTFAAIVLFVIVALIAAVE